MTKLRFMKGVLTQFKGLRPVKNLTIRFREFPYEKTNFCLNFLNNLGCRDTLQYLRIDGISASNKFEKKVFYVKQKFRSSIHFQIDA